MARVPYHTPDGRTFAVGDWLRTEKGVGKFVGAWVNPVLGAMTELRHYRSFAKPNDCKTVFVTIDAEGRRLLDSAVVVDGPWRPKRKSPPRRRHGHLTVIDGGAQ